MSEHFTGGTIPGIVLTIVLAGGPATVADTVVLKNGAQFEGVVEGQSERGVVLRLAYGTMSFSAAEVKSVRLGSSEENARLAASWEKERQRLAQEQAKRQEEAAQRAGKLDGEGVPEKEGERRAAHQGKAPSAEGLTPAPQIIADRMRSALATDLLKSGKWSSQSTRHFTVFSQDSTTGKAVEAKAESGQGIGKGVGYPQVVWTKVFSEEVKGVALAKKTGAVVANTLTRVYYFQDNVRPLWSAGEGQNWKHVEGLGISGDGNRVLFQTDLMPKVHTEGMNFTVHLLDGAGKELWAKPNPYRWEKTLLSPSGKYILFGEQFHPSLKLHDDNLNLLWHKNIQIWYVAFDPLEHFIFDGEGGQLYTLQGEPTWDFGAYTKVLSVSDDAEYVMTQFYRSVQAFQRIFLIGRLDLKKIELSGTGGCVSPDGALTAYVNSDKQLVIYKTAELLEAGGPKIKPLFKTDFVQPWVIQLGRGNQSLFVLGKKSELASVIMLIDLAKMKKVWERPVDDSLRLALPTEDNQMVVIQQDPKVLLKLKSF